MTIKDPVEILYLCLMYRWQKTAPPDRHYGTLDESPEQNSQVARLAYVLKKIAIGQIDRFFGELGKLTSRKDGSAYVLRQKTRLESPYPLWKGWYLEGCASLEQKRVIIRQLRQLGLSPTFVKAVDDFVSGDVIDRYFPTEKQEEMLISQLKK